MMTNANSEAVMIDGTPRYFAPVMGIVKDIADPKKRRRIRVIAPAISPAEKLPWALPADASRKDWLPKVDDIVWMQFQGGFAHKPIWGTLAVAKEDVSSDFLAEYTHERRIDHDYNGNTIDWSKDAGSPSGTPCISVNGTKRLATEDLLAYIKADILDWLQTNLTEVAPVPGWLAAHTHGGIPVDGPQLVTLAAIDAALLASIAQYETDRAAGGKNLTNKMRAE